MAEQQPSRSGAPSPVQEAHPHGREQAQERRPQAQDPAQALGTHRTKTARQVGETAAHDEDQGREQLGAVAESLEDRIRDKPLQSVVLAAGVGLFLALLLKR